MEECDFDCNTPTKTLWTVLYNLGNIRGSIKGLANFSMLMSLLKIVEIFCKMIIYLFTF